MALIFTQIVAELHSGAKEMFDAAAWLTKNAPGYAELPIASREAITTFSLLWSLFEAQVLNESANAEKIVEHCERLGDCGALQENDFSGPLAYFRDRYSKDGELDCRFGHLHLRKNDHQDLVERVILKEEVTVSEKLAACLIISYRYRNNYFHGIKWAYDFHDQKLNFETSNKLLAYVMDVSKDG